MQNQFTQHMLYQRMIKAIFIHILFKFWLSLNQRLVLTNIKKTYKILFLVFKNKLFVLQGRHGKLPRIKDDPGHVEQVLVYYFHRKFHIWKKNQILRYFQFLIWRQYLIPRFNCLASSCEIIKSQRPIF